jgi:acyl carrier protein
MTEKEVLLWLTELFEEPQGNLQRWTLRDDIPNWDSLGVLNLMADIDEKFEILLSDSDLQDMRRIDDIFKVLESQGKLNP